MLLLEELLDALEARGLLPPDATFEEFEAVMNRLERKALEPDDYAPVSRAR